MMLANISPTHRFEIKNKMKIREQNVGKFPTSSFQEFPTYARKHRRHKDFILLQDRKRLLKVVAIVMAMVRFLLHEPRNSWKSIILYMAHESTCEMYLNAMVMIRCYSMQKTNSNTATTIWAVVFIVFLTIFMHAEYCRPLVFYSFYYKLIYVFLSWVNQKIYRM